MGSCHHASFSNQELLTLTILMAVIIQDSIVTNVSKMTCQSVKLCKSGMSMSGME